MVRRLVDLDARRAALSEIAKEKPLLTCGGVEFEMPAELPLAFAWYLQQGDVGKACGTLFGDRTEEFLATGPSMGDMEAIVEIYGVESGESSASAISSTSNGKRPKQTSRAITAQT